MRVIKSTFGLLALNDIGRTLKTLSIALLLTATGIDSVFLKLRDRKKRKKKLFRRLKPPPYYNWSTRMWDNNDRAELPRRGRSCPRATQPQRMEIKVSWSTQHRALGVLREWESEDVATLDVRRYFYL